MKRSKTEHNTQCAIVRLLRLHGIEVFAVPNGGSRHVVEAVNLKKEGVTAGVSDLVIILKDRVVFAEIKTAKGRQQQSQKDFEERVRVLGHEYVIWRSVGDCHNFITNYLF